MPIPRTFLICLTGLVLVGLLTGCDSSSSDLPAVLAGPPSDHPHVPLLDAQGNHLTADSTVPYSPRQTCGGNCHDYDSITQAYHFQQGRVDDVGTVQMDDDFFQDGRTWLKSDGMYGKW